jgi:hypothetical protein
MSDKKTKICVDGICIGEIDSFVNRGEVDLRPERGTLYIGLDSGIGRSTNSMWVGYFYDPFDDYSDMLADIAEETSKKCNDSCSTGACGSKCKDPRVPTDFDGMICSTCKDLYPYAEPNQSNGTLICYKCRNNL